jgi:hypothetical protein
VAILTAATVLLDPLAFNLRRACDGFAVFDRKSSDFDARAKTLSQLIGNGMHTLLVSGFEANTVRHDFYGQIAALAQNLLCVIQ